MNLSMMSAEESNESSSQIGESEVTFKSLGVVDVLCEACEELKWTTPTSIQKEAIPEALKGHDIIGLAETGSGKTAAFAIPVLQALLQTPQRLFALVLTPTRELAQQIEKHFLSLGAAIGVQTALIVGGLDMAGQTLKLSQKPHVIIGTPGRLLDHLENTKGFSLKSLKFLVLDEADKILDMDFEKDVDKILKAIPRERRTYLYSATMTQKVEKLQRASLQDPIKVEVSKKYQTVENLDQYFLYLPQKHRDVYLVHVLNKLFQDSHKSVIVFCKTCNETQRTAFLLRNLGFAAIPLYGKLSQPKRFGVLQKFKAKACSILIATDVASRGLDIPFLDVVINFDIPDPKTYIHRVGRTARAGRFGKSITFVTQYTVMEYGKIEAHIQKELPSYLDVNDPNIVEEIMTHVDRVNESQLITEKQMKEFNGKEKKRKNAAVDSNTEDSKARKRKKLKKFKLK